MAPGDADRPGDHALARASVGLAFDRASSRYDAAARLQATVRDELLSRLEGLAVQPGVVIDLGAGTGAATAELRRRYADAQVLAVDLAPGMLRELKRRSRFWRRLQGVAGDAMRLPLKSGSVDLVFSSLMYQWCDDLDAALAEAARVLKPGGLLLFSSFGPETLRELRSAWASVDAAVHVNHFVDMHDLGGALQRAGFAEPVLDVDRHLLHYADAMTLMRELKAIGAHNVNAGRAHGLTGRHRFAQMIEAYETRRAPAGLPATYEVVYAAAWRPVDSDARIAVAPESRVSREALVTSLRRRRS